MIGAPLAGMSRAQLVEMLESVNSVLNKYDVAHNPEWHRLRVGAVSCTAMPRSNCTEDQTYGATFFSVSSHCRNPQHESSLCTLHALSKGDTGVSKSCFCVPFEGTVVTSRGRTCIADKEGNACFFHVRPPDLPDDKLQVIGAFPSLKLVVFKHFLLKYAFACSPLIAIE